ncbi:MAG TPA: hypothetical protein V6D48_14410 [Oculatellaceae cyanobacterium]
MKISGRYTPGLYAGVTGFLLLVGINALSIPESLKQAKERDRYQAEANLEQTKAETAKKVADTYSDNQIANFNKLILIRYTLSEKPPHTTWLPSVDKSKKVFVYDRNRKCIGYAYQGKFFFIKYYDEGVCKNG